MHNFRSQQILALVLLMVLAGCKPSTSTVPTTTSSSITQSPPTQIPTAALAPIYWPTNGWQSTSPEAQGMDSVRLAQMVESLQAGNLDLNSLLIIRNGYMVSEIYLYPYTAEQADHVFSTTKSVISMLVGIAIEKGSIKDVHQTLFSILPSDGVKNLDDEKKAITLENLLTQTSGFKCPDNPGPGETYMEATENWVQFMLDQPMVAQPGTHFEYCTSTTHLVSAILSKATGISAREFANQNLFGPLGIGPITEDRWPSDPQGVTLGGYGLILMPRDMAKLGYLFLNHGDWEGNSIVPAEWVATSTSSHSDQGDKKEYGYLWWVDPQGTWYAALGRAGHHIFVYPAQNLVVVFTASLPFTNDADLIPLQDLLNQYILPSIQSNQALPANADNLARLDAGIKALSQPMKLDPQPLPPIASEITGKAYTLNENPFGWTSMIFTFQDGAGEAKVTVNGTRQLVIGLDNVYRLYTIDSKMFPQAVRGRWENENTLGVEDITLGQLSNITLNFQFTGSDLKISGQEKFSGSTFEIVGVQSQ